MNNLPDKQPDRVQQETLKDLELDVSHLETALSALEHRLNSFEALLRSKLQHEIIRIGELTALYKQHKQAKKAKRLEQKKRGKNYQEPKDIKQITVKSTGFTPLSTDQLQQLKKLYKEAIVQVHPDKFAQEGADKARRATDLTMQLNALYQQEDLEELSQFHQHILSGNAMSHVSFQPASVLNTDAMILFLMKKKKALEENISQLEQSTSFEVLSTYENPASFVDELREQFQHRIRQLEKRTRKIKG